MPVETSLRNESTEFPTQEVSCTRPHPRFPVEAQVTLARVGIPDGIIANSKDLSWDGASLFVPQDALEVDDSVVLGFPWREGEGFSACAEVAWKHRIDDQRCLVGVSFSKLGVCDEKKLRRLLSLLMRKNAYEHDISVSHGLRISFLDRGEMLAVLEQIRFGCVETTLFRSFQTNERFPLVVTGFGDLPTLHLRARVLWQKACCPEGDPRASRLLQIALALDHADNDLKRVADPLIARLRAIKGVASSGLA